MKKPELVHIDTRPGDMFVYNNQNDRAYQLVIFVVDVPDNKIAFRGIEIRFGHISKVANYHEFLPKRGYERL